MREEVLQQLREEVNLKKQEVKKFNDIVERIRQLQQDPNVIEYINLLNSIGGKPRNLLFDEIQTIRGIFNRLSYSINENDTNKIYVCLGTFHSHEGKSDIYSICDDLIDYNSPDADYRLFQDIELSHSKCVPISKCKQFENEHKGCIIYPNPYTARMDYSKIQDDFVTEAIRGDQQRAREYILSKYSERKI